MAQGPDWQQLLEAGMQFTELRRSQARKLADDLVEQGRLARSQLTSAVDELVEMSRRRSEELRGIVRAEVQRQLGVLGIATKDDLARLERKLSGSAKPAKKAAKKATKAKADKPAKKPAAKKAAGA